MNIYEKPFLVEWFGARGDGGITDDSEAIINSIMYANNIELSNNKIYYLENPININRSGSISINGNGGKIIGRGFINEPLLKFGLQFSEVEIENLKIDGELVKCSNNRS